MKHLLIPSLILLILVVYSDTSLSNPSADSRNLFPLSKGAYWIYQGPTKWTENADHVREEILTWKMEVIETIDRGETTIAIVKGYPGDLAWYEEGQERGDYLIVRAGASKYYLLQGKRMDEVLKRLDTGGDGLAKLLSATDLLFDFPLIPGKVYGEEEEVARSDRSYCWVVESKRKVMLSDVKGLVDLRPLTEYQLRFQTRPDHIIIKFVKGIGITEFEYAHHGTVSETALKLIEIHHGSG